MDDDIPELEIDILRLCRMQRLFALVRDNNIDLITAFDIIHDKECSCTNEKCWGKQKKKTSEIVNLCDTGKVFARFFSRENYKKKTLLTAH